VEQEEQKPKRFDMREIKFRGQRLNSSEWLTGTFARKCDRTLFVFPDTGLNSADYYEVKPETLGQYTGHKTINGRELYEDDIVFVEEAEDHGDVRYYLVIVWINEWSMFASLHIDEYQKFIVDGYKALDEAMFWTYTLENSEKDFHYEGNIHENQTLL
jgi:uncharacterized phage protein (TIGR01671 family)